MRYAYPVAQVRAAEAALMAELPPGTLMQRAASGLAVACRDLLGGAYGRRVVVVAGSGDNGGDALWAGARLADRGARVDALVLDMRKVHGEGLAALRSAGGRVWSVGPSEPVREGAGGGRRSPDERLSADVENVIRRADLVLDGIVGIGGRPGLRPAAAAVMDAVAGHGRPVVAVDVASGVDVDTGEAPLPHVRADVTVTFGTHKIAHFVDPAAGASGVVELVDIGLGPYLPGGSAEAGPPPVEVLGPADVAARLPLPGRASHKYTRGVVGVVAGSRRYPGAAVLAVAGALGGLCGMVRYVGPDEPATQVLQRHPDVVRGPGRVQAWVVGSGLGDDPDRAEDVRSALASGLPVLVDADGLRHLPERCEGPVLLTPHEGELARLLGVERAEVEARRLHVARLAAERWNATVLLKGAATVIAAPDGRVRVNVVGTPWVATAGSGDVLSGVCGSLLASGLDPLDAGSVGAFLHGTAGILVSDGGPITAYDIAEALPAAVRSVLSGTSLSGAS